jgi:hypothetical protein
MGFCVRQTQPAVNQSKRRQPTPAARMDYHDLHQDCPGRPGSLYGQPNQRAGVVYSVTR